MLHQFLWGGPPGPQPTPWSASEKVRRKAGQGASRGAGAPPHTSASVHQFAEAAGNKSVNVLPLPGALATRIAPP